MPTLRRALIPIVLAAFALTACTGPASAPLPTSTGAPSASATPEPVVATPGPRVPGGCDYLFPESEAVAYLGADAARQPDDALGGYPVVAANEQAGLADCTWTGAAGDVTVAALADGSSAYVDFLDEAIGRGQTITSVLTSAVGERGSSSCYGEGNWSHCEASFAVNGYWVTIYHNVDMGIPAVYDVVTTLATSVHGRLESITEIPPRFVAPVTRDGSEVCPAGLDPTAAVFAAAGVATGYGPRDEGSGDGLAIWYQARTSVGHLSCAWTGASDMFYNFWLDVTPGSAWAWPEVSAAHPDAVPVSVPGASEAIGYCDANQCWIDALVGESWIQGSLGTHPDRGLDETAASLAAAIPLVTATLTPTAD